MVAPLAYKGWDIYERPGLPLPWLASWQGGACVTALTLDELLDKIES